jgi:hypothetical protein
VGSEMCIRDRPYTGVTEHGRLIHLFREPEY